nr:WcbI family polysaccharide biosynthesis putative acetyltransferase [Novosphingobium panipatense]
MFTFRAYHPDLTYLKHNDSLVDGPTNHYHSAIVYACFKAGLDQADTLKRFNGGFFERCGYLGLWQSERDRLVEEVNTTGVDIAASIRRWGREDAFMYSINHPKIRVLRDIASQLIKRQGRKPIPGISPHDNLASGPHFAVYPEIAESLGVKGEYVFKNVDSYRPFGLEQFVHQSFDVYAGLDPQGMMPHQHIDHVMAQL